MLIYRGQLQSYHVDWRGNNEEGVVQDLLEIGRSE